VVTIEKIDLRSSTNSKYLILSCFALRHGSNWIVRGSLYTASGVVSTRRRSGSGVLLVYSYFWQGHPLYGLPAQQLLHNFVVADSD
jgi:hypothetical protein